MAVRENRYVAEHLVSSLYAQDRNYGTSPQPKASARIQIVTDTEVLENGVSATTSSRIAPPGELADNATLRSDFSPCYVFN